MSKTQKVLTTILWALAVVSMVSVIGAGWWNQRDDDAVSVIELPAGAGQPDALPVLAEVPEFSLIDQDNKPFTRSSLLGKPWVAAFVFTHCAGPCPMMTAKMSSMQTAIADQNVQLVTFTVDPERDTPEVLKEYAKQHSADESRWHFLTGDKDAIFALARGMLITAEPAKDNNPILHSEKFVLVDADGNMRWAYDSKDDDSMKRLTLAASKLAADAKATTVPAK